MSDSNAKITDKLKHLNLGTGNGLTSVLIARVVFASAFCIYAAAVSVSKPVSIILLLCAGILAGIDLIVAGVLDILHEEYFSRNAVITLVFVISFIVGVGFEGALLMILTQIGLLLTGYVNVQVRNRVLDMTQLDFESANVVVRDRVTEKYLDEIRPGEEISVLAGEYFPVDCIIMEGSSTVDSSHVTGRKTPQAVTVGDTVLAGSINLAQPLRCEVISDEGRSTAQNILWMLDKKDPIEEPGSMKLFTPILMLVSVLFAALLAVVGKDVDAYEAIRRALALFTLSSALPAFSGMRNIRFAARAGAAIRGSVFSGDSALTKAAHCRNVVFSAEGTLTAGNQKVVSIHSDRMDSQTFLKIAAHAVAYSRDPSANAIIQAYNGPIYIELVQDFVEIPNCGVKVVFDGIPVVLGTQALMAAAGNDVAMTDQDNAVLYMTIGHEMAGSIMLSDPIRKSSASILSSLHGQGIQSGAFVTSYSESMAEKIAKKSGITQYKANCGDDAKLQYVEHVQTEAQGVLLYLSDEKRHGQSHSAADLDAVVGHRPEPGDDAIDIILPGNRPALLCDAISAARTAQKLCYLSMGIVFAVKAVLIALAAFGLTTIWFSAFVELSVVLGVNVFSLQAFFEQPFQNLRLAFRK